MVKEKILKNKCNNNITENHNNIISNSNYKIKYNSLVHV